MSSIIVLNADMNILHEVNIKKAISLLTRDVVEPIGQFFISVKTHTGTITIPKIMKLKKFIKNIYNQRVILNKENILYRDKRKCGYCGKPLKLEETTIDHVVPKCMGGRKIWENCVVSCRKCNEIKGNKSLKESKLKLRKDIKLEPLRISSLLKNRTKYILQQYGIRS